MVSEGNLTEAAAGETPSKPPVLIIKDLVKQYRGAAVNAVDGINFEVREGEMFCLLGVNGAGKSTTINIICTLLKKTSGEVLLGGYVLDRDDDCIRRHIGVVFQKGVLDAALTAEENLLTRAFFYGLDAAKARRRVEYLSEQLNMGMFLKSRYGRLSGGQRRKCDIARALLANPAILFLDEPTTGLDPQSRIELWETIGKIRKEGGMTVFLTTHYMEETENADRIAIIDEGKIVCLDTPQRLKSAYSSDTLRLVVRQGLNADLEKFLTDYEVHNDTYTIQTKNSLDCIDLLLMAKPCLHSFEVEKGNMDSVFLNAVGRKAQ